MKTFVALWLVMLACSAGAAQPLARRIDRFNREVNNPLRADHSLHEQTAQMA
jgi:hypothetical protein